MTFTIEDSRKMLEQINAISTGVKALNFALENFWSSYCADIAQIDARLVAIEEKSSETAFNSGVISRIQGLIEGISEGIAIGFNDIDQCLIEMNKNLPKKRKPITEEIKTSKEA